MPKKRARRNPVPKAPPKRRFAGAPPVSPQQLSSSLARVRRMSGQLDERQRPFSPERRGSWQGSSRDLVVNGGMDEFTRGFLTTALWATNDESDDNGGEPLDQNYSIDDFAPQALKELTADCEQFQRENADDLAVAYEKGIRGSDDEFSAGHDFWLTRCGHCACFWDGDYPEPASYAPHRSERKIRERSICLSMRTQAVIYADGHWNTGRLKRNGEQLHFPFGSKNAGAMLIDIPTFDWKQIDGDMDPCSYGGTIARADGTYIELIKIQPTREYVGDDEAKEVGFPFWTREASYDLDDLSLGSKEVQGALSFVGLKDDPTALEDATPDVRALMIATALMDYGHKVDEAEAGFSNAIIQFPVKWWSGDKPQTFEEFCGDEDDEFRREVLGETGPEYTYKMTYEVVTPESAEDGEAEERGWEEEGSEPYESLEDVLNASEISQKNWIEWSDSTPSARSWLVSEADQDFRTGADTTYNLWIMRADGTPLDQDELREISRVLGVRMR